MKCEGYLVDDITSPRYLIFLFKNGFEYDIQLDDFIANYDKWIEKLREKNWWNKELEKDVRAFKRPYISKPV